MWGCFLMSGVKILHFLKDWWKSIPIHQNYTMALILTKEAPNIYFSPFHIFSSNASHCTIFFGFLTRDHTSNSNYHLTYQSDKKQAPGNHNNVSWGHQFCNYAENPSLDIPFLLYFFPQRYLPLALNLVVFLQDWTKITQLRTWQSSRESTIGNGQCTCAPIPNARLKTLFNIVEAWFWK